MFSHIFKNSLKVLFKNKTLIFWTFMFPIILGTFFNMAFSNINNEESFKVVKIGIVNDDNYKNSEAYPYVFQYLGTPGDNQMFDITYGSLDEVKTLLEDQKISGYLYIDSKAHIVVKKNGIEQTIFKNVVDEINMVNNDLKTTEFTSMEAMVSHITNLLNSEVKVNNTSNKNLDYVMIEFYTLIAMSCLYGGTISMYSLNQVLPDMSNKGKRVGVSPIPKGKLIVSNLLASFIVQLLGVFLLFLYTIFVLNVDYGPNMPLVVLTAAVGSFAGLSIGIFVSSVFKKSENAKIGIIVGSTMFFSFLAGMMGITMKYVVDTNMPILNIINPVNMITDALYALYSYNTFERFTFNIISLLIFSFVLLGISYTFFRRNKYDSI